MCLVSYVPTKTGFFFSSNRDESPSRNATQVAKEQIGDDVIYFPKDTKGGSWIFLSERKRMICLLNGAFNNHPHRPPYKKSRGLMCKEYFDHPESISFLSKYDFWNIEPFTLIMLESVDTFFELRWDGNKKYVQSLVPHQVHVWSSSTLYDLKAVEKRKELFLKNLSELDLSLGQELVDNHLLRPSNGDPDSGLYINRGNLVKTISHTQILYGPNRTAMSYYNLLDDSVQKISI